MSGSPYPDNPIKVGGMLDSIIKKDEDTRLLHVNQYTGSMELETSVDLTNQGFCEVYDDGGVESPIDTALLRDDATGITGDMSIRIIFIVFSALAALHFATATVGILFYLVLLYDETKMVSIIVLSVSGTLCGGLYLLMAWQRKSYMGVVFASQFAFCRVFVIASMSQLIGNELLYLMEFTYLFQSAVLVVYTSRCPRNNVEELDDASQEVSRVQRMCRSAVCSNAYKSAYARRALVWTLCVSSSIWSIGLVIFQRVFFTERIWLWGLLMYPYIIGVCFYQWWYVGNMVMVDGGRYSLSVEDLKLSVIEYYTEPIVLIWNKFSGI